MQGISGNFFFTAEDRGWIKNSKVQEGLLRRSKVIRKYKDYQKTDVDVVSSYSEERKIHIRSSERRLNWRTLSAPWRASWKKKTVEGFFDLRVEKVKNEGEIVIISVPKIQELFDLQGRRSKIEDGGCYSSFASKIEDGSFSIFGAGGSNNPSIFDFRIRKIEEPSYIRSSIFNPEDRSSSIPSTIFEVEDCVEDRHRSRGGSLGGHRATSHAMTWHKMIWYYAIIKLYGITYNDIIWRHSTPADPQTLTYHAQVWAATAHVEMSRQIITNHKVTPINRFALKATFYFTFKGIENNFLEHLCESAKTKKKHVNQWGNRTCDWRSVDNDLSANLTRLFVRDRWTVYRSLFIYI